MFKTITFIQFQKLFTTSEKCYKYLLNIRWPNGFVCPICNCSEYSFIKTRKLYQCKSCRYQCSLTAGTIFHKTRTPLYKLFWLVFFIAHDKNGHSALDLTRKLKMSYKAAWSMCHKVRAAMLERNSSQYLAGLIELDDAYYGQKNVPGTRGRGAKKKTPVLVAAQISNENKVDFVSMKTMDNLCKETIQKIVKSTIEKGATLKTDGFQSYGFNEEDYNHKKIVLGSPKNAMVFFPWVHIFIANSKSIIACTHKGVSPQYLRYYLSEFCYKLNRRFNVDNIFSRLLFACTKRSPITLAELKA